jgi:hypothetical protein
MFRRAAAVALFGVVLGVGGFAASAAIKDAPPGATALCNDGTYSFSQTRSGTCSHHGGVAQWLTATPASTTAMVTTATATATTSIAAPATTLIASTATYVSTPAPASTSSSAPASNSTAPPGATARCTDGTYSFSKTHSGTCSHHGGVATWLDGSGSSAGSSTGIALGSDELLGARDQTSHCVLGVAPDRACSPGAIYSGLTKAVLCSSTFHTSSIRNVPDSEKHEDETEYGLAAKGYGATLEIDHVVSLELGGSNDIANLFPERAAPAPGYHVKDKLENKLHDLVCAGLMTLHAAQVGIAANWRGLYSAVFGVTP